MWRIRHPWQCGSHCGSYKNKKYRKGQPQCSLDHNDKIVHGIPARLELLKPSHIEAIGVLIWGRRSPAWCDLDSGTKQWWTSDLPQGDSVGFPFTVYHSNALSRLHFSIRINCRGHVQSGLTARKNGGANICTAMQYIYTGRCSEGVWQLVAARMARMIPTAFLAVCSLASQEEFAVCSRSKRITSPVGSDDDTAGHVGFVDIFIG